MASASLGHQAEQGLGDLGRIDERLEVTGWQVASRPAVAPCAVGRAPGMSTISESACVWAAWTLMAPSHCLPALARATQPADHQRHQFRPKILLSR
jgi:hypothetical protein